MSPDFNWIKEHIEDDPTALRLKFGASHADDILQIEMRRKHRTKLDSLFSRRPCFVVPGSLAAEQSTSCRLAAFHASLIAPGDRVADLTAGLGVDTLAFAETAAEVVAVEKNPDVAAALEANTADDSNISVIASDCRDVLENWIKEGKRFDAVFIDPARRNAAGGRVFLLADCEPDVVGLLPEIRKITSRLIIKASPMLDISLAVGELGGAEEVIALGTPTECKELDFILCFGSEKSGPKIRAVTVGPDFISEFDFTRSEEQSAEPVFGIPSPGDFIYDPYPAVMKAAPFRLIGNRFGLKKLGPNTHLWFSPSKAEGFPGSVFRAVEVLPYMSKHIKRYAARFPSVSVTALNFDMAADALRKKLRVVEGSLRLFAVKASDGQKLLITCERI